MIVPEALLAYPVHFNEVHLLTTRFADFSNIIDAFVLEFRNHFPDRKLTITVCNDFNPVEEVDQVSLFEELLFKWYLLHYDVTVPTYVCLAGGIKLMPVLLQKAARFFGAIDVFHVMASVHNSLNPKKIEQVLALINQSKIKTISIGIEPGWFYFRQLNEYETPFLVETITEEEGFGYYSVNLPKHSSLVNRIQQVQVKTTEGFQVASVLPFGILQLLPEECKNWLYEPMGEVCDLSWLTTLPKIDLHCHLGGFASHGDSLDSVRAAVENPNLIKKKQAPELPVHWPLPEQTIDLSDYMKLGDNTGSTLLKDKGALKRQVELIYENFQLNHVVYAEVRCSPDNYSSSERNTLQVLQEIISLFQDLMNKAQQQSQFHTRINLIIIATRSKNGDLSSISRHLALAIVTTMDKNNKDDLNTCKVVGVDLAGYENIETRASYFLQDFVGIHRCGLAVTAHAGENDDAEGIWEAVFKLNARRLGHALSLIEAPDLLRSVADRQIGVEMCPYANFQIKGFYPMAGKNAHYPLREYLKRGIKVTVNTDNIGISGADLTRNLLLLTTLCPGITRIEVLQLIRNSFDVAFISNHVRNELLSVWEKHILTACLNASLKFDT